MNTSVRFWHSNFAVALFSKWLLGNSACKHVVHSFSAQTWYIDSFLFLDFSKSQNGPVRETELVWFSLRAECILIGIFDLVLMAFLHCPCSPIPIHIHLTRAIIWLIIPAILLIIGASMNNLHCMWPWVINNAAFVYFFVFYLVDGSIERGQFIKTINIAVDTTDSHQSIDAVHVEIGFWIMFMLLVFLLCRLDSVCRFMRQLYVESICRKFENTLIDSQTIV